MVERLRPRPRSCTDIAWREIGLAMNARPQRVVLTQNTLDELCQCHENRGGRIPDIDAVPQGRKYVVVDRLKLFAFANKHGEICEKGK